MSKQDADVLLQPNAKGAGLILPSEILLDTTKGYEEEIEARHQAFLDVLYHQPETLPPWLSRSVDRNYIWLNKDLSLTFDIQDDSDNYTCKVWNWQMRVNSDCIDPRKHNVTLYVDLVPISTHNIHDYGDEHDYGDKVLTCQCTVPAGLPSSHTNWCPVSNYSYGDCVSMIRYKITWLDARQRVRTGELQ